MAVNREGLQQILLKITDYTIDSLCLCRVCELEGRFEFVSTTLVGSCRFGLPTEFIVTEAFE